MPVNAWMQRLRTAPQLSLQLNEQMLIDSFLQGMDLVLVLH